MFRRKPIDGAPEPCEIVDFVRARLQEKQPLEASSRRVNGSPSDANDSHSKAGDAAVSANVGLANAVTGLGDGKEMGGNA